MNVLVIQTAFLGDVVLTTPLLDALATAGMAVDVVVTPAGAQALRNHHSVRSVILYDKKGNDRGLRAFLRVSASLRSRSYDVAVIPHRSLRSAMLGFLARIPRRIGFDKSTAAWSLTDVVRYEGSSHEIVRNLELLRPLRLQSPKTTLPSLTVASEDVSLVGSILSELSMTANSFVAIAPGSVWNTKRWPEDRFAALARALDRRGMSVLLIGGGDDRDLCERIRRSAEGSRIFTSAGRTNVLQSAELIRLAAVLVTNDSAPLHLASAMGTPVVAIFGATSPRFGFGPRGPRDMVVETDGLTCRPCAIHGGDRCPIGTFECMLHITAERVEQAVLAVMRHPR